MSVTKLARLGRVSEGAIRQLESGQNKQPSFITGLRLAVALKCHPAYLATGSEGMASLFSDGFVDAEEIEALPSWAARLERRIDTLERELLEAARSQREVIAEQQAVRVAKSVRRTGQPPK